MNISKKNLTPIALVSIFLFMLGLSFAAVPLYDLFCRVTGFGGTTQNASNKEIPKIIVNQDYKMRFDTNINSTLDWKFYPEINTLDLKPGEVHTVKFNVENPSSEISSGSATFNVSPSPFGIYLNKIGCFCFEKQTLQPGEKKEFVLTFFLDPKVVDDNKTKNMSDVTLSFTFFSSAIMKRVIRNVSRKPKHDYHLVDPVLGQSMFHSLH